MASQPIGEPQTLKEIGLAIYRATIAFLETLWPMQKDPSGAFPPYAVLPFASDNRLSWYFLPASLVMRSGLPLRSMNVDQRRAALELLRASVSQTGYDFAGTVRQLEYLLRELEMNMARPFRRDAEAYHFTVFGVPHPDQGTWGWRYEGHHCSLQWTMVDGEVIASTPQFLGSSPAHVLHEVPGGPELGTRILGVQEDLARQLVQSLSPEQQAQAILPDPVPGEVTTVNQVRATPPATTGVLGADLDGDQRELVRRLFEAYAGVQHGVIAAERLCRIAEAEVEIDGRNLRGIEGVRFAWIGPVEAEPERLHYYRLFQDRNVLVEYDTPMGEPYHRHTVWRDFRNDYGLDILERAGGAPMFDALGLGPQWGRDPLAQHYEVGDQDIGDDGRHHHHGHGPEQRR